MKCRIASARVRAFTLVELLVVIAIIGVLVALLLPAVQSAREAARRMSCSNNMKQVALGLHNFHDTYLRFPHGVYDNMDQTGAFGPDPYGTTQDRRSWFHDLLPFIEQSPLFEKFDAYMKTGAGALNFPDRHTVVKTMSCPSDPLTPKVKTYVGPGWTEHQGFSGNLITLASSTYFNPGGPANSADLDGIFYAVSKVKMAEITDGTANTAFVSETVLSQDHVWHDIRGRYHNPVHGGVLFSTRLPPNSPVPDQFNWCSPQPAKRAPCINTTTEMFLVTRSYHPQGVNMAFADGSVRFMQQNVTLAVFQSYGTRNGGEATN
jgi:prepilin-type N-terminal cleavage/methylation domain-containing protein/prepilin-type processing-associated H-X9-DG protein